MFVGHYGASYAASAAERRIPLWLCFLAVQFLDVVWGILVLLGIERVRIVPGITATNPLDLYYMPYSHSLAGALLWSVAAGVLYALWRGRGAGVPTGAQEAGGRAAGGSGAGEEAAPSGDGEGSAKPALIVGAAVFSHWVLDLLVHRPDLPLVGDRLKVGLGLWDLPLIALLLEVVLLFGGLTLYLRVTARARGGGTTGFVVFGLTMVVVQTIVFFGAPPASAEAAAISALVAYGLFAAAAAWLERKRRPVGAAA